MKKTSDSLTHDEAKNDGARDYFDRFVVNSTLSEAARPEAMAGPPPLPLRGPAPAPCCECASEAVRHIVPARSKKPKL